ncbi:MULTISPECIES: MFS transporter [unclassified Pseudomonas]|uniref:MFS transporter n=1 Tax=unclassified Pseudomonas TaxID=196821 RepID=UPI000D3AED42|nr:MULTISPECIES: MFS transporter [unclassified Pseudomonas]RAU43895.1 MFS transporter [Pseudomonas sp. RIT 409]RAU56211.1 MFS transporter [Pseudomonas sp. RIT 412]
MNNNNAMAQPAVLPTKTREQVTKAKKATRAAVFGTFVEYYDFSVYGYVAATLATVFFPSDDPTIGLLNAFLVFGSAFLVRPLGAIGFGWLGDKVGRRTSLIASITLMGAAATLIGLLPGYAVIGVWAPTLLVALRMLQGFSAGGEIGGAASYIREWAPPSRRSLYISFLPSIAQLGKGLAAAIAGLAAATLTDPQMLEWGWRVPFLLALPLGIIGLWMRLSIEDSPEFEAKKDDTAGKKSQPFAELISSYPRALFKVVLIALVQNIGTYIGTVFIAAYFSSILGYSKGQASTIVLIAVIFAAFLIPLAGQLGSYRGGKSILRLSYIAYAVLSIPSFILMQQGSVSLAIAGLALGMIPYALCQAGTYSVMPEFFPMHIRHTGVAFGHSVGAVIGGGAGPYFATWLIGATGNQYAPAYILCIAGVIGLIIISTVRKNAPADQDTTTHQYS